MFVTLVLLVFGAVLIDMRKRLQAAEMRLALLEGAQEPSFPPAWADEEAPQPAQVAVRTERVEVPSPTPVEPLPQPAPPPAEPARPGLSFEDLFGRRLPIWAGGATLAVAGVLLVRYSIEAGLLSSLVRAVLGLLFGGALIGGAEAALRQEARLHDPRVRQALAGAGLATLYVGILAAHGLYGLVGPATAFAGLAAVTALAMGLALRFGAPSALLGLVGGLAAPALVEAGQPNVPLLSCYLALAVGGLAVLSRTQRWMWLGVSALIGGAGWGVALIAMGALDWASSLSVGLLMLMLGVALPALAFSGARATVLRIGAAVVAAAQMAALVATGGFALLHWGLFGLLSAALVWLGRDAKLRPLAAVGLGVALMLAGLWPDPDRAHFALVLAGMAAIYGGTALWRLWRPDGGLIEAGQIAGLALGGFAVTFLHFEWSGMDRAFAGLALAAAALPVTALAMGWRKPRGDGRFVMLATAAALLIVVAGALGLADWALAAVIAAAAAGLLMLAEKAGDQRVEWSGWAFAFAALVAVAGSDDVARLWGEAAAGRPLRWIAVAAMAGLFAWRAKFAEGRLVAQGAAVLLAYGAMAQFLPPIWLPVGAALGLPLLAEGARRLPVGGLLVGLGVAASLIELWALWPLAVWLSHALLSLLGDPMLVRDLPAPGEALRRLALPAGLLGVALWRAGTVAGAWGRRIGGGLAGVLGGVALHVAYKQVFGLETVADVTRLAFAERTVWEALLIGTGFALWWKGGHALPRPLPQAGGGLIGLGLAHLLVYTLLLHNPLWFPQAVGAWPIANLLLPAFALAFGALWLIERMRPEWRWFQRPADLVRMLLIALFALAALRQMFAGSVLTVPGLSQAEDIARSVLALGLAIGFLLWGIHRQALAGNARDWRIASLLLMLAAVAKVFLLDASGLSGLLRIGSFLALGFSLIGIGWLYNRVLRDPVNDSSRISA